MAQPTLANYQQSTWSGTSSADEVTASATWSTGSRILVVAATEDSTRQLNTPTATGLTFAALGTAVNGANNTRVYMWSATAASGGSGAITCGQNYGGFDAGAGVSVFVFDGCDGFGTPVGLTGSTAKTISVTRGQANSHVVCCMADWNQVGDVTVTATPTGTVRVAQDVAGRADFFVVSFGDQGATGTTAYGIASHTGTVDMSGMAVEVLGTTSSTADLSGTSTLTFTTAGNLAGSASLTGASTLTFTTAGNLLAAATLSGTSSLTFTTAGALQGSASLIGASSITFTTSGNLAGSASLTGASSISFTPAGVLIAYSNLQGETSLTFTTAGTLLAVASLSGTSTLDFLATGNLLGAASLSGSSALVFTTSGNLDAGSVTLSGTSSLTFTTSGNLVGAASLSGTSSLTFDTNANLQGTASLAGSTTIQFTTAGDLTAEAPGDLSGTSSLVFTAQGNLDLAVSLSGQASLNFTVSGNLLATSPSTENTIDGQASYHINTPYASVMLYCDGNRRFFTISVQ